MAPLCTFRRLFKRHSDRAGYACAQNTRFAQDGFTLIEVLLASFIFTIIGMMAITIFVNILHIQRKVELENAMYEDARFMMERIAREVRKNTIDYEEYYNKLVDDNLYGVKYGCYASRFYDPGSNGKLGISCSNPIQDPANQACLIIDKTSYDVNTGQNPYTRNPPARPANAMCDENTPAVSCTPPKDLHQQDELYLIDSTGTEKTLLAKKTIVAENNVDVDTLALLRLDGEDNDEDGIAENWTKCDNNNNPFCCAEGFVCPDTMPSLEWTLTKNLGNTYMGFIPISPSRTTIKTLQFVVAPLEDPRKAFDESSPDIQQQPHVTVLLTVGPSANVLQNYTGEIPSITLQTTITSRVYNEVRSFYAKATCSK